MLQVVFKFLLLQLCLMVGFAPVASAQIAVITHKKAFIDELSLSDLSRIYGGEMTSFSPLCVHRELSESFFQQVMGKSDKAVKKLWVKLLLSGRVPRGPVGLDTDDEVMDCVRQNPEAIGFANYGSVDNSVKILKIDNRLPSEDTYLLRSQL